MPGIPFKTPEYIRCSAMRHRPTLNRPAMNERYRLNLAVGIMNVVLRYRAPRSGTLISLAPPVDVTQEKQAFTLIVNCDFHLLRPRAVRRRWYH